MPRKKSEFESVQCSPTEALDYKITTQRSLVKYLASQLRKARQDLRQLLQEKKSEQ